MNVELEVLGRIEKSKETKVLDLSGLGLKEVPLEVQEVPELRFLDLSYNKITFLPRELFQASCLEVLHLEFNQLTPIPSEIGQLTKLNKLYIHRNHITSLPPEIGNLTNLTYLDVGSNNLTTIPEEFENLSKLKTVFINQNRFTSIPYVLLRMKWITHVWANLNPIPGIDSSPIRPAHYQKPAHTKIYRIRRVQDGLFSKGGLYPKFTAQGKVWGAVKDLISHFGMFSVYDKMENGEYKSLMHREMLEGVYRGCEVVINDIDGGVEEIFPFTEYLNTLDPKLMYIGDKNGRV